MLIGGDDIRNDVIALSTCISMLVYIRVRFRFALIGGNVAAQSTGSHRGIGGGIQIPRMQLQALLPFLTLLPDRPKELARRLMTPQQSFIPQPSIERRSHYVRFPWKQTFWMTTNRKRHQKKVNSHCLKLHGSYSVSFNLSNVGEIIFLGLNPKGPHLRLDKEKENFSVVFTTSIKTKSGCVKLGSFISQSCNDGYKKA